MPSQHGGCVYPHALLGALHHAGHPVHYGWIGAPLGQGRRAMRDPLRAPYIARGWVRDTVRIGRVRVASTLAGWLSRRPASAPARPAEIEHLATPAEQHFAADLIKRTRPGAVIVDGTPMLTLLDGLPSDVRTTIRVFVLTHNLTHRRTELYRAAGQALDFLPMSAIEESALLRRADTVVAIQDREAEAFRALLPGKPVITVPMPCTPEPLDSARAEPDRCLFVGGYSGHNILAVQDLVRAIWPRIRATRPNAQLAIAGTVGKAVGAAPPGVQLLGPVSDLRSEYARASVCLVPLPMGTGLKIKMVEAMSCGRPVVTTRAGAEGFDALESGDVVRVADTPGAFADACTDLLCHPPAWERAVTHQLDWIRQNLSGSLALRQLTPLLA